jgi:hypothetical protein
MHAAQKRSFSFPWGAAGHPAIPVSKTVDEVLKLDAFTAKGGDPFNEPRIIAELKVAGDLVGATMSAWAAAFAKESNKSGSTKMQSEMKASHGKDDMIASLVALTPAPLLAKTLLPSVKTMIDACYMFGFSETMAMQDTEPSCLGSLRWIAEGSVSVLIVSPVPLRRKLYKVKEALGMASGDEDNENELPDASSLKHWMEALDALEPTVDQLKALKEFGVAVFHGTLSKGSVLITPPGHLVAFCTLKGVPVSGVRRSFLPLSKTAVEALSEIVDGLPEGDAFTATLATTVAGLKSDLREAAEGV